MQKNLGFLISTQSVKGFDISSSSLLPPSPLSPFRYIALFAARKEKGVGAKKHSKGKQTNQSEEPKEKRKEDKKKTTSPEEKTKRASAPLATSNEIGKDVSEGKDVDVDEKDEEEEFEPSSQSILTKNNILSTNDAPEANQDEKEGNPARDDDDEDDENNDSDADDADVSGGGGNHGGDRSGDESDESDVIEFDRRMSSDEEFSDEEIDDMITEADTDKDGQVNYEGTIM